MLCLAVRHNDDILLRGGGLHPAAGGGGGVGGVVAEGDLLALLLDSRQLLVLPLCFLCKQMIKTILSFKI